MLQVLLNAVLPIFAVAGLGYFYGRKGILGVELAMELNRFVFYFALPVLLFKLLASVDITQFQWGLILAYLLAELALYGAGYLVTRHGFKRSKVESLLVGMTAGFVNHVMFVLPIAEQLYGPSAMGPIVAVITLDAVVMFAGTIMILEAASETTNGFALFPLLKKLAKNPQIIAIGFGTLAMIFGVRLEGGFKVFAQFVGDAAPPASLFALGIILATQKVSDFKLAATLSGLKLLVMPLVTWVMVVHVFGIKPDWANPALLVAAGPAGAMAFVLALQYKVPVTTIAYIILITTVGSVIGVAMMSQLI